MLASTLPSVLVFSLLPVLSFHVFFSVGGPRAVWCAENAVTGFQAYSTFYRGRWWTPSQKLVENLMLQLVNVSKLKQCHALSHMSLEKEVARGEEECALLCLPYPPSYRPLTPQEEEEGLLKEYSVAMPCWSRACRHLQQ